MGSALNFFCSHIWEKHTKSIAANLAGFVFSVQTKFTSVGGEEQTADKSMEMSKFDFWPLANIRFKLCEDSLGIHCFHRIHLCFQVCDWVCITSSTLHLTELQVTSSPHGWVFYCVNFERARRRISSGFLLAHMMALRLNEEMFNVFVYQNFSVY